MPTDHKDYFRILVRSARVGIIVVSPDDRIEYANPFVEGVVGYPPDELVDQPFETLLAETESDSHRDGFAESLSETAAGDETAEVLLQGRHRDGHELTMSVSVSEFQSEGTRYVAAIVRAVSDRRLQEGQLRELKQFAQRLSDAGSPNEVCERTVHAARTILRHPIVTVELYEESTGRLEPCSWSSEVDELTADGRLFTADRSLPWDVFANQSRAVLPSISEESSIDEETTPLRSALVLPIGTHGVLIVGATDERAFSDTTVGLATILVANTYSALERIEREQALRERTNQLEERTESLDRVRRLNTVIRDLTKGLTDADGREQITEEVCARLAASDPYQFAWFGTRDSASNEVVPEASAGDGEPYLDGLSITVDEEPSEHEPISRAVQERTPQVDNAIHREPPFEPWRKAAIKRGYRSSIAVPIVHQDTLYGVLSLYAAQADVFDRLELSVLRELGEMVGYALNAEERRQAFTSERSVELAFSIRDRSDSIFDMVSAVGGEFHLENLVERRDGNATMFFCNEGADADELLEWASDRSHILDIRLLTDREGECLFECVLDESTVWSQLLRRGAMVREANATTDSTRLVIRISRNADARSFDTLLEERLGDIELVARRKCDEPIMTTEEFEAEYRDRLTERQEEVLQTAYYAGFFEWPRETKSGELADILGIAQPTVSRHLRSSEETFLSMVFDDE